MIKPLEDALVKVVKLPERQQALAAELLEQLAAENLGTYSLSEDERTAVREALARARKDQFALETDTNKIIRTPWA